MALFVYVTEHCWDDARKHGYSEDVGRLKERVEGAQSLSLFDPFPPGYYVKKKFGGRQGRLIAGYQAVGQHAIAVFLAILIRGDRAYEEGFAKDPEGYGARHFAGSYSDDELAEFVAHRTATSLPPPKPVVNQAESGFLYSAFQHHEDPSADDLVCETREWVDLISQDRFAKQLALLYKPCMEALSRPLGLHCLAVPEKVGWSVWVLRQEGRLLLLVPGTEATARDAEQTAKELCGQLQGGEPEAALRACRRAYPSVVLADDELWIDLERESEANMALSLEESEVLESARRSNQPFPLFINGRAGSGKSTILQYLFADLLYSYLETEGPPIAAPPIYLTASGELLRVARTFVGRLLASEAAFVQRRPRRQADEQWSIPDGAFREFRQHLLSLLPPADRSRRFPEQSFVDYPRFRQMWRERFGKEPRATRDFGPDLSWHVIRSYIKGMSSETFLEPDEYRHLPHNQVTVTASAFDVVHERVWTNWYEKLTGNGLWDDQDLTRHILDNDLAKPIHPAVFCDEAQDFTRLELELLLRLNLFSNRSLSTADVSRVPFAFAGDQFQTLNPTGFRWDAIKASFVEKFLFELDPARTSGRTDLNYRELHFNYRSTHRIVRFSNQVQALRAALFQLPDLKPQRPWTVEQRSVPVVWFRSDDAAFWAKFSDDPGFVVVVPCNEGEELEYVTHDPVLRERVKVEDGVPHNVLSPARAKGCEYPAVMVYGFGDSVDTDLSLMLDQPIEKMAPDPDTSLPLQYFLNRLYVAVSRAKRRLIIVDTSEGFRKLWRCAQEEEREKDMLRRVKNGPSVWATEIEGMFAGKPDDVLRVSGADPLENARAFEQDGKARHDAFLLRQAAQAYKAGGDLNKSRECRARALDAEAKVLEAGEAFLEAGWVDDAIRCFWQAYPDGWGRIRELIADHPEKVDVHEVEWVLAANCPSAARLVPLLERVASKAREDREFAAVLAGDQSWRRAMIAVLQPVFVPGSVARDQGAFKALLPHLEQISATGIQLPNEVVAWLHFGSARYVEAARLWETLGLVEFSDYYRARANSDAYPQALQWLSKLEAAEEIVERWTASIGAPLNADQIAIVAQALQKAGRLEDAVRLALDAGLSPLGLNLALRAFRAGNKAVASKALHGGLYLLAKSGPWEMVVEFATTGDLAPDKAWKEKQVRDWTRAEAMPARIAIIRGLARALDLPQDRRDLVADFLKSFLRVKGGVWRSLLNSLEAGAALERWGRPADAVAFYEALLKEDATKSEKDAWRRRQLVCKRRLLRVEVPVDSKKRLERDIASLRQMLRLPKNDELPSFPVLPDLGSPLEAAVGGVGDPLSLPRASLGPSESGPATVRDESTTITLGPFRVEVSRRHRRCNITNSETKETAYVKVANRECGGEADFIRLDATHWKSEAWGITIVFGQEDPADVTLCVQHLGLTLTIEMGAASQG